MLEEPGYVAWKAEQRTLPKSRRADRATAQAVRHALNSLGRNEASIAANSDALVGLLAGGGGGGSAAAAAEAEVVLARHVLHQCDDMVVPKPP